VFLLCSRARNPGRRARRTRRWHLGDHTRNRRRDDHGKRRDRARSAPRPGLRRSVGLVAQVGDDDTCSDTTIVVTAPPVGELMERLSQGADESSSKDEREAACDSASSRAHRFRELSLLKARGPLGPVVRSDRYRTVRTNQ
jgi:hypothetical protein